MKNNFIIKHFLKFQDHLCIKAQKTLYKRIKIPVFKSKKFKLSYQGDNVLILCHLGKKDEIKYLTFKCQETSEKYKINYVLAL